MAEIDPAAVAERMATCIRACLEHEPHAVVIGPNLAGMMVAYLDTAAGLLEALAASRQETAAARERITELEEALRPFARRPNVHAENLLSAGRRYGDAKLALERSRESVLDPDHAKLIATWREASDDLLRAARAYATRMRRKPPATGTTDKGGERDG